MSRPCRPGFAPNGQMALAMPTGQIKLLQAFSQPIPVDHIEILAALGVSPDPYPTPTLPLFNDLSKLSKKPEEKRLWQLGSILFDPILILTPGDANADELSRLNGLSRWLAASIDSSTSHIANPIMAALLLKNDLHQATIEARLLGLPRLACQISMAHSDPSTRSACFERQLLAWQHQPELIDSNIWGTYELLAGRIGSLLERHPNLPWIVQFAAYFWFGLAGRPFDRLLMALQYAQPPSHDIRLYMISLFVDSFGVRLTDFCPLESVLSPRSINSTSQSFFLPWALGKMLSGVTEFRHQGSQQKLDAVFAEELEACGYPVLAHQITKDPKTLLRNQIVDGPIGKLSKSWMLRYRNASEDVLFDALVEAEDWESSCEIISMSIGPNAIISADDEKLYDALIKLPKDFLERTSSSLSPSLFPHITSIFYLYLSLRLQTDQPDLRLPTARKLLEMIEALPKSRLNDPSMLMPRIALTLVKEFVWTLSEEHGLRLEFAEMSRSMALTKAFQLFA